MTALNTPEPEATETARLLSIKDACRILGLSRTTLYAQLRTNEGPRPW
jgi:predicted DNA-binding transcriptional regulator AlpA